MKNLLLSAILTIGFMSSVNAGTITIVREEGTQFGPVDVNLSSSSSGRKTLSLRDRDDEKNFDLPRNKYTIVDLHFGWVPNMHTIDCTNLKINVGRDSRHIIQLSNASAPDTVRCAVKDD